MKHPSVPQTASERRSLDAATRLLTSVVPLLLDLAGGWRRETYQYRAQELLEKLGILDTQAHVARNLRTDEALDLLRCEFKTNTKKGDLES